MSYGLNIIGSNGNYQIEDGFTTFLVRSLGVVANGTELSSYFNPAKGEVLLLRPSTNSGSLYTGRNSSSQMGMMCSSGNISYIVATPAKNVPSSPDTFGLRVWGDSESLIFDSGSKYMLPVVNSFLPKIETAPNYKPTRSLTVTAPQYGRNRYIDYAYFFPIGMEPFNPMVPGVSYWHCPKCTWVNSTSFYFDVTIQVGPLMIPVAWFYPANRHFLISEI